MSDCECKTVDVHSVFLSRVASLPSVLPAVDSASQTYVKIKESSKILNYALDKAERSALFAVDQGKPILGKFSKQIKAVDDLACRGLDNLQERFPMVKKAPNEIVAGVKGYSVTKFNGIKDYSSQTLSRYTDLVAASAQEALTSTDAYLDRFFPPLDNEQPLDTKGQHFLERVETLSTKARVRLTQHATRQLLAIHKYGAEKVQRFELAMTLLQKTKDGAHYTDAKFKESWQKAVAKSSWLKDYFTDEKEIPSRLLALARKSAADLADMLSYSMKSMLHFPSGAIRETFSRLLMFSSDLLTKVSALKIEDLSSSAATSKILSTFKDLKETYFNLAQSALDYLRKLYPLPASLEKSNDSNSH